MASEEINSTKDTLSQCGVLILTTTIYWQILSLLLELKIQEPDPSLELYIQHPGLGLVIVSDDSFPSPGAVGSRDGNVT